MTLYFSDGSIINSLSPRRLSNIDSHFDVYQIGVFASLSIRLDIFASYSDQDHVTLIVSMLSFIPSL